MKIKLLTSLIASAGLLGGLPGIAAADYPKSAESPVLQVGDG